MYEQRIAIVAGQTLTLVELAGNAKVVGCDGAEIVLRLPEGGAEDVTVEQAESGPVLSVRVDCELQVPAGTPVAVRQAQGNLKVAELATLNAEQVRGNLKLSEVDQATVAEVYGNLKAAESTSLRVVGTVYGEASLAEIEAVDIQNVRGGLRAKEVGRLRVSRVAGGLVAKEVGGTLEVDQVGGDAVLKEIGGLVTIGQVAGNLLAKQLGGGASVSRIGGNLAFAGILGIGRSYQFKAGGNAVLRLEEDAAVHLSLKAGGRLVSSLALTGGERTGRTLSGLLNDGGAELAVEAGANLVIGIGGHEEDEEPREGHDEAHADEFGRRFDEHVGKGLETAFDGLGRQMEATFDGIGRQVEADIEAAMGRLRVKLDGMDWSHMGDRAHEAVERAMKRLEQDSERLAERMARQEERLRQRAERDALRARRHERTASAVGAAAVVAVGDAEPVPEAEPEPDRDQERLTILKMVEQGQITPKEAEMLLEALE